MVNSLKFCNLCALLMFITLISSCKKDAPAPQNPKPTADFTFTFVNGGVLPTTVNFISNSKDAVNYRWSFDDGNSSTAVNPSNTFSIAKTYNVKLVVSNTIGSDSITKQVIISFNKPVANFSFSINDNKYPVLGTFSNTTTGTATYEWFFDNGDSSTQKNPIDSFFTSRTYNVKLIASNSAGQDSITKQVIVVVKKPVAAFTYNKLNDGQMPCNVSFVNTSQRASSYSWSFGNGNTAINSNPQATFTESKFYNVKLTVTNPAGTDTITKQVTINRINKSVRFVYLISNDKSYNQQMYDSVRSCALSLQQWYRNQMGTKTFVLNNPIVEVYNSTHSSGWFQTNNGTFSGTDSSFFGFNNAREDMFQRVGNDMFNSKYIWVVYYTSLRPGGGGGAGSPGYTFMPQDDLTGLIGLEPTPPSRWVGGAGHELGHAFGLPHPANLNSNAIMWTGYSIYPNCILQQEDRDILNANTFFK